MSNRAVTKFLMILVGYCTLASNFVHAGPVKAYFNNNQDNYYKDPYRNIDKRGDDLEKVILEYIESANKSIWLAVQEFRLPRIAHALAKKKADGIDVRVVLENQYNKDVRKLGQHSFQTEGDEDQDVTKFYDLFAFIDTNFDGEISNSEMAKRDAVFILNQANIEVKDDTNDSSFGSGLMHHKFVVVDGRKVLVSSANFTLSGVHGDYLSEESNGNANGMISLDNEEVARLFAEEFSIMWGDNDEKFGSRFGVQKPYRGPREVNTAKGKITVQFSPTTKIQHWPSTVNGLIGRTLDGAVRNIDMALFVYSDQEISEVLRKKILNNPILKLSVLVEPKFAYRNYSELLDLWGIKLLDENCRYEVGNHPWRRTNRARGGVSRLPRGDVLHHKFGIVDDHTVIFGSQNWSDAANLINDEYAIVIEDSEIAKQFKKEFNRLASSARFGAPKNLIKKIRDREDACLL